MDLYLRCNNHAGTFCRKELRGEAYVTTYSHNFYKSCVQRSNFLDVQDGHKCLACSIDLPSAGDVVSTNLQPSEARTSTILSGLDPNTIMECAGKAMRFWNYQMSTEIAWQKHLVGERQNRYQCLNNNARRVIDEANPETEGLQQQVETLSLEKQDVEKRVDEMVIVYNEKNECLTIVTNLYDALKKKVQDEQTRDAAVESAKRTLQSMDSSRRPEHLTNHTSRAPVMQDTVTVRKTPQQSRFSMDNHGVEQLHPFQRSGSAPRVQTSSELAAATFGTGMAGNMAPPSRPGPRKSISRPSTSSTPAHRISLGRPGGNHTFPQSVHR